MTPRPELDIDQEEADMLRVLLTDHGAWLRSRGMPELAINERLLARVPLFVKRRPTITPIQIPFEISQRELDAAQPQRASQFGVHPTFEAVLGVSFTERQQSAFGFDVNVSLDIENEIEPSRGDAVEPCSLDWRRIAEEDALGVDVQPGDCGEG